MASLARRIAEGTFVVAASNSILAFLGFVTSVILIRSLGKYDFGLLTLALSAFAIASIFLDMGMSNVLISDVANELGNKKQSRAKSLLWRYVQVEIFMGVVLFAVVFLSGGLFAERYNETVGTLVRISAFLLIFFGFKNVLVVTFNSHTKFHYYSFMQLVESISKLFFVIILVTIMHLGVIGAMFAYLLSYLTSILFSLPLLLKTGEYLKDVERAKENLFFNTIVAHGKYAMVLNQFNVYSLNVPFWIIKYFSGTEAVGVFSVAWKMSNFLVSLPLPLNQVLIPLVSEIKNGEKKKLTRVLHKTVKYSLIFSIAVFICAELFVSPAMDMLFSSKYRESVPIFRILIIGILALAFNFPPIPIFFRYKAQKYLFITYLVNFFAILVFGSLFTSLFGIWGMASVTVFCRVMVIFMRYYYLDELFDIKLNVSSILKFDEYDRMLILRIMEKIKLFFG